MIRALVLTAAIALTACNAPADDRAPPSAEPNPAEATPSEAPAPDAPASRLELQPMTFDEFSAVVPPGLGCAFEGGDAILFVASAPDDTAAYAQAVVKIADLRIPLAARQGGRYEALMRGGVFEGADVVATVSPRGGGEAAGIETTAWEAELTVRRGEAEVTLPGTWSCGA